MLNNNDRDKLSGKIFNFFRGMAAHPFAVFLIFFALAGFCAGWIFLDYRTLYMVESQDGDAPSGGESIFSEAKAEKYRKVFSVLEQREEAIHDPGQSSTVSQLSQD